MNFLPHLFRIAKYGTSYAIATGFFPTEIKKNVLLLYSFVRIPDNIVDDVSFPPGKRGLGGFVDKKILNTHYTQAKIKLKALQKQRTHAYTNNLKEDPIRGQYIILFQDNSIPFQYSMDFFKAMIDDCTLHRYKTYAQLEGYMYGSASVVGLMMCHIIGFIDPKHEKKAKSYATVLGNAMQLTNFLRDIREDYEELNRIYLPSPSCHEDIISFCHGGYAQATPEKQKSRSDTMKVYIARCRTMYTHSLDGLQYLRPEGRQAVRLAALLYESILDKIEASHYDVFTMSCRTNLVDKFKTLYRYKTSGK